MTCKDLGLPIEWQVPCKLGCYDMRCKRGRRHSAIHEACRRWRLGDPVCAGPAGIARANGPPYPQDGGNDIERFGGRFSDAMQVARAARACLALRLNDNLIAWQMLGKRAHIAPCRSPWSWQMILPAVIVGSSRDIREVAEIQTGLGGIDARKLLRPSPMDQALEIVYLGFEIGVLRIESTNRSAQMLDILQKLILGLGHAEDYHSLVNLQAITITSRYFRRLSDVLAIDLGPIQPGDQ